MSESDNREKSYHYTQRYMQRYIYYDFENKVDLINDIHIPGVPEVIFSINQKETEQDVIKRSKILSDFIKIDFTNRKVFCYNNITVGYYDLKDLEYLLNNFQSLHIINPGEYLIVNKTIINKNKE